MIKEMYPVVILAGGLATRLRPLTEKTPKALLKIHDEPFIAHQLRLLKKEGIKKVVMCVGYLGEQIIDFVGDGSRFGLQVSYVFDGPILLGTAGAIKQALPLLDDVFFVLNGDSYLPCNYAAVQEAFIQSRKMALMTVFYNQGQWDTSNVELVDGRIVVYDKQHRTQRMLHIDYGLEVFTRQVFDDISDNQVQDLVPIYQKLLSQDQLAAYEVTERFYENGSVAGILDLENYFSFAKEL